MLTRNEKSLKIFENNLYLSYLSLKNDYFGGPTVYSCTWLWGLYLNPLQTWLSLRDRQLSSLRRPPSVGSRPVIRREKAVIFPYVSKRKHCIA